MHISDIVTTQDSFLDGRLELQQLKSGPRTAIDAFFLAASIPARQGKLEKVLDAGTGNGAAGLALCQRVTDVHVTGVDIQPELLDLAAQNARHNALSDRFCPVCHDLMTYALSGDFGCLERESFQHVAANPPYQDAGASRVSDNPITARAYSAGADDLEKWVDFLTAMAVPGGTLTMIHRADTLSELLALLGERFGAVSVYPLFPKQGAPAKRVLVHGIKGSRAPLRLLPGMVLHEADGAYTRAANDVLRGMSALSLGVT